MHASASGPGAGRTCRCRSHSCAAPCRSHATVWSIVSHLMTYHVAPPWWYCSICPAMACTFMVSSCLYTAETFIITESQTALTAVDLDWCTVEVSWACLILPESHFAAHMPVIHLGKGKHERLLKSACAASWTCMLHLSCCL